MTDQAVKQSKPKLSDGHKRAIGLEKAAQFGDRKLSRHAREYLDRNEALKDLPLSIIRRAWFSMAHLLLAPGAHVVDMGCRDGDMTFAMAVMYPHLKFTGIDLDKKRINKARQLYQRDNLEYRVGDITTDAGFDEGSLDAIINSFILHEVYAGAKYHDRPVVNALERQFSLLKPEGQMFIRDYAMPPPGEFVLIEMPDAPSTGEDIHSLSEPDLLVWYSEHARPRQDPGCNGFFLEELPPRYPNTRLFRLPYKWAYEFINRKDDRETLQIELPKEYAFFTQREYRKALRSMGARVLYSSPHWDEAEISEKFEGHFRLYNDDGTPLGPPPTSFVALAQKIGERKSLLLLERRPSHKSETHMKITAMRNERSGKLVDVASRNVNMTEVIPYRVTESGDLTVFLHEGAPRGIANAVLRSGKNLDEKRWSGHMTEAIGINSEIIANLPQDDVKAVLHFARDHLGLKPVTGALMERGPGFYPAPEYIEEFIGTRFLRVESTHGPIAPKTTDPDTEGFTTKGMIREVSAQSVLNAISVGYIPSSRLEVQLLTLFDRLGLQAETWEESPMILREEPPESLFDFKDFAKRMASEDRRYKTTRGSAGQLRPVQSIFVDEGWVDGGISGLGAQDLEFVISDESTLNKVAVLPLTKNAHGQVMAGISAEYLPVPQRFQNNGLSMRVPCFDLPKDITNLHQTKKFIADKFGVKPQDVYRLGESYYCHLGVTPQRIFPFAVACNKGAGKMLGGPVQFAPMDYIWNIIGKVLDWNCDELFLSSMTKAYRRLSYQNELSLKMAAGRDSMYGMTADGPEALEDMTGLGGTQKGEGPAFPGLMEEKTDAETSRNPLPSIDSKKMNIQ